MKKIHFSIITILLAFATIISMTNLSSAYYTENNKIFDNQNNLVNIRGINWAGFHTKDHIVHGLWTREWKDMISQIKATGFNTLRIPYCAETIKDTASLSAINYWLNPDFQGLSALEAFDKFLKKLEEENIYFILDHHHIDCTAISPLWYSDTYNEQEWLNDLTFVADRYKNLNYFMGIDIKNEPYGATWGTGNTKTDWDIAAAKAGKAILEKNKNMLIFIEGIHSNPTCSNEKTSHYWGENIQPLECYPIDLPKNKTIYSPHIYGPDVYYKSTEYDAPNFPENMEAIWEQHFGRFIDKGYTLVIGEWGGQYGLGNGHANDKQWQDAIVDYFIKKGITNTFYWTWNANSGDTGGILTDDWNTIHTEKVENLRRLWDSAPTEKTTNTSPSQPSPEPTPIQSTVPDETEENNTNSTSTESTPEPSTSTSPVETTTQNTIEETNAHFREAQDSEIQITTTSKWNTGYCNKIYITPDQNITDWKILIPTEESIFTSWNAKFSPFSSHIQITPDSWNKSINANKKVELGYCAKGNPTSIIPELYYIPEKQNNALSNNTWNISIDPYAKWGDGYCANIIIKNITDTAQKWNNISLKLSNSTLYQSWSGNFSGNTNIEISPLLWNKKVYPNHPRKIGFCANGSVGYENLNIN